MHVVQDIFFFVPVCFLRSNCKLQPEALERFLVFTSKCDINTTVFLLTLLQWYS